MTRFDLTTLRVFLAVAQEESIARASEVVHLAASAISKRVSELEHDLDVSLLDRNRSGVTLTAAGRALVLYAQGIVDITDRISSEMSMFASGVKGHVRMAANPSSITQFLPPVLSSFHASYPDIRIELLEQTSTRTIQLVADRAVDIGIVAGSVDFAGMPTFDFRSDKLAMLMPRSHSLANRRRIAFADTLHATQVGLAEGSSIQATLIEAAKACGRTLDLKVRVASFDALRNLVAAGIGIACLPIGCIKPYGDTHGLVAVPLSDNWANRQLKVCIRDPNVCPIPVRRLLKELGLPDFR